MPLTPAMKLCSLMMMFVSMMTVVYFHKTKKIGVACGKSKATIDASNS